MYEEHVIGCNWKVGVVEELIVGKDGHARGAKVRLVAKGKPVYFNRPFRSYVLSGLATSLALDQ